MLVWAFTNDLLNIYVAPFFLDYYLGESSNGISAITSFVVLTVLIWIGFICSLSLWFLERFCTALSTTELDFETKKLLLIPRSFKRPKYDKWDDISEVVSIVSTYQITVVSKSPWESDFYLHMNSWILVHLGRAQVPRHHGQDHGPAAGYQSQRLLRQGPSQRPRDDTYMTIGANFVPSWWLHRMSCGKIIS